MNKDELLDFLLEILNELISIDCVQGRASLCALIDDYKKVCDLLAADQLLINYIKASPRAYLEIYNDYGNPLLEKMDVAQKKVQEFIDIQAKVK